MSRWKLARWAGRLLALAAFAAGMAGGVALASSDGPGDAPPHEVVTPDDSSWN